MAKLQVRSSGQVLEVVLDRPAVVVGSAETADLVLADETLCPRHTILIYDGKGWHVEDLNSVSGTCVNGSMILGRCEAGGRHWRQSSRRHV